jgi:AAA+ ATPase superfamily predicted ATPase
MQEHIEEYNYLEDVYQKKGQQITIVYGMNQIGKSFLMKNFSLLHDGIYFSMEPGSAKEIKRNLAKHIGMDLDMSREVPDYHLIFKKIFQESDQKTLLIFDKFHNIVKGDATFFPELINYIQMNVKNCMICFVSSHIGFVENQMISKIGQSATAITGFLKMREMSFDEVASNFPDYTTADALKIYTVLGGQFGYISCMQKNRSVRENILKHLFSEHSYIFAKMHQYIEEQLRETGVYYSILEALASGNCKLNDLYHYTGFSRAKISVYLKALMELEFVEKVFSVDTPGRVNVQKGIYRISNPLLHFYFKFIYPNESDFLLMESDEFYDAYITNELKDMTYASFINISRNMFAGMNAEEDLPIYCELIGEWVGKKGTIPIVAKNSDEEYLVGFCNDTKQPFTLHEYEEYRALLPEAKIKPKHIYLFSMNGFEESLQNYDGDEESLILIDLE